MMNSKKSFEHFLQSKAAIFGNDVEGGVGGGALNYSALHFFFNVVKCTMVAILGQERLKLVRKKVSFVPLLILPC